MAGKDGEMFMTRSFSVTPKTTEQHLFARSDKSVAYVTKAVITAPDRTQLNSTGPDVASSVILNIWLCVQLS